MNLYSGTRFFSSQITVDQASHDFSPRTWPNLWTAAPAVGFREVATDGA